MAFSLKYNLTFEDLRGTEWTVEIYQDPWAGAVTQLNASDIPVTIDWQGNQDIFDPIKGSECTFTAFSMTNFQLKEFWDAKINEYYILIKKGGVDFWSGMQVTDIYSEPYADTPYSADLKFSCGLGELQYIRYEVAGAVRTGIQSLLTILGRCLANVQPNKNIIEQINVFEDRMNKTNNDGMLLQTTIDQGIWIEQDDDGLDRGMKCLKVIRDIMKAHGCRIFQSNNKWYVQRVKELGNASVRTLEYNTVGVFQSTSLDTVRLNITNKAAANQITWMGEASLSISEMYNRIEYEYDTQWKRDGNNLILNTDFTGKSKLVAGRPDPNLMWIDKNTPRYYDFGNTIINNPTDLQRTVIHGAGVSDVHDYVYALEYTRALLVLSTTLDTSSWIRPIERVGSTETIEILPCTTSDKLQIILEGQAEKFIDFATGGYFTDDIVYYKIDLYFLIRVGDGGGGAGDYYLTGDMNSKSWTNSGSTIFKFTYILYGGGFYEQGTINRHFNIHFLTPTLPVAGMKELEIKFYTPVNKIFNFADSGSYTNMCYLKRFILNNFACLYMPLGDQSSSVKEIFSKVDDDTLRDKTYKINVRMGDGPYYTSQGSLRIQNPPTYDQTEEWDVRGGAGPTKDHENIFLLAPAKEFITEYHNLLRGRMEAEMGFHNSLLELPVGDNRLYIFDSMSYDIKNNEYNVSLQELTSRSRSWDDTEPGILAAGITPIIDFSPKDVSTELIDEELKRGKAANLKTNYVSSSYIIEDFTESEYENYPISEPATLLHMATFNENDASDVADYSQNGNASVIAANLTIVNGDIGLAGRFNGTTTRILYDDINSMDGLSEVTVFGKINKSSDKLQVICGKGGVFRLRYLLNGKAEFSIHDGAVFQTIETLAAINTAEWHSIAGSYDGSDIKIYVDGVEDNSAGLVVAFQSTAFSYDIGYNTSGPSDYFDGDIENVQVRNNLLSSDEHEQLNATPGGPNIESTAHGFLEGDLISTDFQDTSNRALHVVTLKVDADNFHSVPTNGNLPEVRKNFTRYGNTFDTDRQASMVLREVENSPELRLQNSVGSFTDFEDPFKNIFFADAEGFSLPFGYISGFKLEWKTIEIILVGEEEIKNICKDSTDAFNLGYLGTGGEIIDTGVMGVGGLDTGSLGNFWYFVYVIGDSTGTNPTNVMFSKDYFVAGITFPAGYDIARRVGSFYVNDAFKIRKFFQTVDTATPIRRYYYDEDRGILIALNKGNSLAWATIPLETYVPNFGGVATANHVDLFIEFEDANQPGIHRAWFRPTGSTANTPVNGYFNQVARKISTQNFLLPLVSDPSVEYRLDDSADNVSVYIYGYCETL